MKQTHYKFLDGLRALAALYVVVHHALPNEAHTVFAFGHLAVTLFIVLSGFCLMLPVAQSGEVKGGFLGFFARRWKRILPPYYAALALAIVAAPYTGQVGGFGGFVRSITEHLTLSQDFGVFPYGVSAPLWSVAAEWHIYLTFPLIVLAWRRWGVFKTAAGMMALALVAEQWAPHRSPSMHFYGDFALGACASTVAYSDAPACVRLRERLSWGRVAAVGGAALVVLLVALGSAQYETNRDVIDLPFSLLVCALLIACATGAMVGKVLGSRPLAFVGGFSYSMYLIHMPLILLNQTFTHLPLWGALPAIVLASFIFHLLFERPFMVKRTQTLEVQHGRQLIPGIGSKTAPLPN